MSTKTFTKEEFIRDDDGTLMVSLMLRRSIRAGTVTVASSATKIPTTPLDSRIAILIMNISANIIYIGGSTVTTANGFPIYPNAALRLEIEDSIDIYGIASTSSEVRILEGA